MALQFQFKSGVEQRSDGDDLILEDQQGRTLRLRTPHDSLIVLLQRLADGGDSLVKLMQDCASLTVFTTLQQLEKWGWISLSLSIDGEPLLTLEPQSRKLVRIYPPVGCINVQWSQFVQITPQAYGLLLEGPLRGVRLAFQHQDLLPLIWELGRATLWETAIELLPQAIQEQADDLLMLMLTAGVLGFVEADGTLNCDREPILQFWSREDMNLHHRSRSGWHDQRIGATYPGAERGPAPALLLQSECFESVFLPKLKLSDAEPGFFSVLEKRHSLRRPASDPLTLQQIGYLLWATLRIREVNPATPGVALSHETALKPVACAGGLQEIDAYLLVRRCTGLKSGLYRYEPLNHQLLRLDDLNMACEQLLHNACCASGTDHKPDVLFQFAARYGRVSWKYEGVAYALILKHMGVIMQQLYLVATALNLSACSLGGGDSELFARATKLNPWSDVSIGEFMLSATSANF